MMFKPLSILLLGLCTCTSLFSQEWELQNTERGISVFTRPNPNSELDQFKGEMKLSADLADIADILCNPDKHRHIFPSSAELRILERPSNNQFIQYSISSAPWPVSDRDGVYEMNHELNKEEGTFDLMSKALPDYLPREEDMVRIELSNSSWHVSTLTSGELHIIYEVAADPGGSIPAWLSNSAAVDIPFETLDNLRTELMED